MHCAESKTESLAPCLAMGIPVVLAKSYFGERFGFIDRLIPTYTSAHYSEIDWNPAPVDFETDKAKIKELFFNKVRAAASRVELERMWSERKPIYNIEAMRKQVPQAELIAGVDTAVTGEHCGVGIIKPDEIQNLPEEAVIIVAAPSAQKPARELLMRLKRPFVLLRGTEAEWYNI